MWRETKAGPMRTKTRRWAALEPDLNENECDEGYDSKNPDDESLVKGEGFGEREEEEEPGGEDEEEDDEGERVVEEREEIKNVLEKKKMRQGEQVENIYLGE